MAPSTPQLETAAPTEAEPDRRTGFDTQLTACWIQPKKKTKAFTVFSFHSGIYSPPLQPENGLSLSSIIWIFTELIVIHMHVEF